MSEGEVPVVKKAKKEIRPTTYRTSRKRNGPAVIDDEELILRAATIHLIRKVGGLFVATALRDEQAEGCGRWIITVTLRYPTGHEGYVGDLLYDGKEFTLLTEQSAIDERVLQIAADPRGIREWNEYRASTLRTGKA
jgi:hypothetical protein